MQEEQSQPKLCFHLQQMEIYLKKSPKIQELRLASSPSLHRKNHPRKLLETENIFFINFKLLSSYNNVNEVITN